MLGSSGLGLASALTQQAVQTWHVVRCLKGCSCGKGDPPEARQLQRVHEATCRHVHQLRTAILLLLLLPLLSARAFGPSDRHVVQQPHVQQLLPIGAGLRQVGMHIGCAAFPFPTMDDRMFSQQAKRKDTPCQIHATVYPQLHRYRPCQMRHAPLLVCPLPHSARPHSAPLP